MPVPNYHDLLAFLAVARERSFTRAAAQLGVSPSALSHTIRALETRMGVRLLTRTTRSVATTEAGEHLYQTLTPRFEEIDAEIATVSAQGGQPAGRVRITTAEFPAKFILWPKLAPLLARTPALRVEISVDYTLADIVAERFDAGVRLGDQVARDMIAVRISADQRIAVVGAPGYFAAHPAPETPHDLHQHNGIALRLPTHGGLMPWEFDRNGQALTIRPSGQWIFNSTTPIVRAALDGAGLAYLPEEMVLEHIRSGQLTRVLQEWCEPYPGYHLYYPRRRQSSPALALVVEALRWRPGN